jgi:hypothetical protein
MYTYINVYIYDFSEVLSFEVQGNCTRGEADVWVAPAPPPPTTHVPPCCVQIFSLALIVSFQTSTIYELLIGSSYVNHWQTL